MLLFLFAVAALLFWHKGGNKRFVVKIKLLRKPPLSGAVTEQERYNFYYCSKDDGIVEQTFFVFIIGILKRSE